MGALKTGDMKNDGFGKRQQGIKLTLTTEQQGMKMTDLKNNAWFLPFRCHSAVAVSSFPLRKFRKNYVSAVRIPLLS